LLGLYCCRFFLESLHLDYILWNIKHLGASPVAICSFDKKKLEKIGYERKKNIFLSGIKMDLIILLILSILSIIFGIFFILGKMIIWYILLVCNTLILIRVWHVINNIFKKDSDLDQFLHVV